MIKTKKGKLKIKGSDVEIAADISVIVHGLVYRLLPESMTQEEAKDFIMFAVERGFKTKEELEAETKEHIGEILGEVSNVLKGQGEENGSN